MPELPEVETIRTQLEKETPFTIEKAEYSRVVTSILKDKDKHFDPTGKTISHIRRYGKMLDFCLDDDLHIVSHLGMSGSWRLSPKKVEEKHTHIQFSGKNRKGEPFHFAYVDPRRFGNARYLFEDEFNDYKAKLGVDISSDEFTPEYIYEVCRKYPNRQIKAFLLDQAFFAGCGNYIACEICARAGIRPTRRCGKITRAESENIKRATVSVLEGQLKRNGLTFSGGYTDAYGEKGQGVSNLVVFNQKVCGMCDGTVKKIVLAQRGTYYCPSCQR